MNSLNSSYIPPGLPALSVVRYSGTIASRRGLALLVLVALVAYNELAHGCAPAITLGDTQVNFPASIIVPINAPVGTIIATATVPVSGTAGTAYSDNCGLSGSIYWAIIAGRPVSNRIGTTSVRGVGYTSSVSGGGLPGTVTMDTRLTGSSLPNRAGANYFSSQVYATVNLVVTGPVVSGTLSLNPAAPGAPNVVGSFFAGDANQKVFTVTSPANATSIAARGCTVTTPSVDVRLPTISTGSLRSIGMTSVQTPFDLTLNCAAGTQVHITLNDVSNTSNVSNVLGLSPQSLASGVGLQILNGGTVVSYGPDSPSAENTSQFFLGNAIGGPVNFRLTARYIRTGATLVAGTVAARATFTMSYR